MRYIRGMRVLPKTIDIETRGLGHTVDITVQMAAVVAESGLTNGTVTLFCPGSTGGLTTIEFEPGVVADLGRVFEQLAPRDGEYQHHLTWGDDNGNSHVRAGLLGPSIVVPFIEGRLTLGTWQQIVFIDFDTRARTRKIVAQLIGE